MRRRLGSFVLAAALVAGIGGTLPARADGHLMAGAAMRDITPENGRNFFGYVRPDISAEGVALRLWARALVLARGAEKVAIISIDYGTAGDKAGLVARLPEGFHRGNVLFAATHTHAGPDVAFGFDDFALAQIARAVADAEAALQPARAGWGTDELTSASRNRSVEAHLANHGMDLIKGQGEPALDPDGDEHTIEPTLSVLRVEATDGTPIAAWASFSMHPTTFIPSNRYYAADYPGVAALRFQEEFDDGEAPVTLFAMRAHGDQSAHYDEYNQHAVADRTGRRVADAIEDAWDDADDELSDDLDLASRWMSFCFCGQDAGPGEPTSPVPFWGASFFGGSEDGASIFYEPVQTEGRRRPAELADPVHGRKILGPVAPFFPTPELHALRIGDRILLGIPGEPSAEMGRRFTEAVLDAGPDGLADAIPVGLSTQYTGYFTTPEEYDMQHYEGGHTIFGKWTSNALRNALVALATAFDAPGGTAPSGSGSGASGAPWTGGGSTGPVVSQPGTTERYDVVEFSWSGNENGVDRPIDTPFFVLEFLDDEGWEAVDSDLGYRAAWRQEGDEYRARYELAHDIEPGIYRVSIASPSGELLTEEFAVVPHDGLIVRGARASRFGGGTLIRFYVQNPPPDPARHLIARDRTPRGGSLSFSYGGNAHTAVYAGSGTYVALIGGDATAGPLAIPAAGVVDGEENTSGEGVVIVPGEIADFIWPPNIGPGGGRTPGLFGEGHFPP